MNKFINLNKDEQKVYFEQVGASMGLNFTYVEKDFWVCWVLSVLFSRSDLKNNLTFKGGTSLSKVWGAIKRFSEDIDLTINREFLGFTGESSPENAVSNNKRKVALKRLREACQGFVSNDLLTSLNADFKSKLPKHLNWSLKLDKDDADMQTLLFEYPTCWDRAEGNYVRPVIKLEFGARSDPWPALEKVVKSFVATEYPNAFMEVEINVLAVKAERTFWEKVMLIHEERFRPDDKKRALRMARHYYDLWSLMQSEIGERAIADDKLFNSVKLHREVFFRITWVDYTTLTKGKLKLLPLEKHIEWWKKDYEDMSEMFLGDAPTFDEILASITSLEIMINKS